MVDFLFVSICETFAKHKMKNKRLVKAAYIHNTSK